MEGLLAFMGILIVVLGFMLLLIKMAIKFISKE